MTERIGPLRERVSLQSPQRSADDIGGAALSWNDEGDVWAAVTAAGAAQGVAYDAAPAISSFSLTINRRTDLRAGWRVIWRARSLRIVGVRGVWRALYGAEPEMAPAYTPDWAERHGAEMLLAAAQRHLVAIDVSQAAPGDVLLFRMDAQSPAKHVALLDEDQRLIHAYWGRAVVRSRFAPWWRARLAAAFSFPGVEPWPS
ncbi:MAG: head-tail adaptor protein [Hyphomonadaceae bacterium]|nr:head-tail adaptor protein [Hyphomonadaceae bacterium]